jgi:hypothetical protein
VTTARDIRDAEWVCRSNASNLRRFATPVALDPLASAHNMRLAVLWEDMADVHAEYAAELEGEQESSGVAHRRPQDSAFRPAPTADPVRTGVGVGWVVG